MNRFTLSAQPLDPQQLRQQLLHPGCGGYVAFEGWVRDHNEGRAVVRLEYEAYGPLASSEAQRILDEAQRRFGVEQCCCAHRVGAIEVGGLAVWVGVSSAHRAEAFEACRFIIDEVKHHVPIWKKEYYQDGDSGWVNCERCALPGAASAAPPHVHVHEHTHAHAHWPGSAR